MQRIEVRHDGAAVRHFRHDLVQMQGCFSIFERQRWESDVHLREGRLVLLTSGRQAAACSWTPFSPVLRNSPCPVCSTSFCSTAPSSAGRVSCLHNVGRS